MYIDKVAPTAVHENSSGLADFRSILSALDIAFHATQARGTGGSSPLSSRLAYVDWASHVLNSPSHWARLTVSFFEYWLSASEAALGRSVISPGPNDHRFQDQLWLGSPFNFLQQSFLLFERWWREATSGPNGVSQQNLRIVSFAARQIIDLFSPSNCPWSNPEVIGATTTTGGMNFQHGWRNFIADAQEIIANHRSSESSFEIGRDLASTPGKVVFKNDLVELLQYSATTDTVAVEPVLIVPAWIMKYYILDLSPNNSLVRWLTARGHTVFIFSWRNPGPDMRDTSLDDYRVSGIQAALDAIESICDGARVHATGYCLGGTLLTLAAAAMGRDGDDRLASISLFCAQTDFTEAGELQLFITDDQLAFLDDLMKAQGYLDSRQMAGAFQLLRSNDLIWSRAVRTYLLGEPEHPNDLMAWNADGTRMPARMRAEYLRHMFLNNDLAEGRLEVGGRPISVGDVRKPHFVVATETDHIAPWKSVYKLHLLNDSELTFVLTSGGHNAGVVSEPNHPHRHYRIHQRMPGDVYVGAEDWKRLAQTQEGSWWPAWSDWLLAHSSGRVTARAIGSPSYPPIGDAPGEYIHQH